jgi:hypothetical protein
MGALTLATACILCAAQPASAPNIAQWKPIIEAASERFAIPKSWIEGVMHTESAGLTTWNGKPITSSAGAMGLMQIMPDTYTALRKRYGLGSNPYDPHDNIFAGTAYLKAMYARYGYPLLFAAYLTGPTHLDRYLFGSGSLPPTVVAYVNSIVPDAISEAESRPIQRISHLKTTNTPLSSGVFFVLKSDWKPSRSSEQIEPNAPPKCLESVFIGADGSSNLFISLSLQGR